MLWCWGHATCNQSTQTSVVMMTWWPWWPDDHDDIVRSWCRQLYLLPAVTLYGLPRTEYQVLRTCNYAPQTSVVMVGSDDDMTLMTWWPWWHIIRIHMAWYRQPVPGAQYRSRVLGVVRYILRYFRPCKNRKSFQECSHSRWAAVWYPRYDTQVWCDYRMVSSCNIIVLHAFRIDVSQFTS